MRWPSRVSNRQNATFLYESLNFCDTFPRIVGRGVSKMDTGAGEVGTAESNSFNSFSHPQAKIGRIVSPFSIGIQDSRIVRVSGKISLPSSAEKCIQVPHAKFRSFTRDTSSVATCEKENSMKSDRMLALILGTGLGIGLAVSTAHAQSSTPTPSSPSGQSQTQPDQQTQNPPSGQPQSPDATNPPNKPSGQTPSDQNSDVSGKPKHHHKKQNQSTDPNNPQPPTTQPDQNPSQTPPPKENPTTPPQQ